MNKEDLLLKTSEEQYGEKFRDHYLEIYKTYVGTADKISERRQTANSFFLSINTAIIGLVSYLQAGANEIIFIGFYLLISISGMLICYMWYRLVLSYKQINSGKFQVIHQIEQNLPLSPYDAEWEMLGRGKDPKKYLPFTHVEILVPWVFFGLHTVVFLKAILELTS
ncbi:MAG: hypothetical protein AB3A66_16155 [Nodularia sp. CChRGM 3473]